MTVVQDPRDAAYSGMLVNALNNVEVDFCVSVAEMGPLLTTLVSQAHGKSKAVPSDIRTEALIAERVLSDVSQVNGLGDQGPYNCPVVEASCGARWNPNGEELFYIGADDRLMAVPIRFSTGSKAIEPGVPRGLFGTSVGSTVTLAYRQQYLVSADGQSFVMNSVVGEGIASPITVILNWRPKSQ